MTAGGLQRQVQGSELYRLLTNHEDFCFAEVVDGARFPPFIMLRGDTGTALGIFVQVDFHQALAVGVSGQAIP